MMRRISEQEKEYMEILYYNNISMRRIASYYGFDDSAVCRMLNSRGAKSKSIKDILKENGYDEPTVDEVLIV